MLISDLGLDDTVVLHITTFSMVEMVNLIHNPKKTQVLFIGRLSASYTVGDSRPQ